MPDTSPNSTGGKIEAGHDVYAHSTVDRSEHAGVRIAGHAQVNAPIVGGDFITQAAPLAPTFAAPPFIVPYGRNPAFVGREDELARLDALLTPVGAAVAIAAMGGQGKTQLAIEYAHHARDRYPGGVFWLHMADPAAVPALIAAFAGPRGLNVPGYDPQRRDANIQAVQRAWQEPTPRLLIFDSCEAHALLSEWRPTSGGSHVLVTSRRLAWPQRAGVTVLPLPALERPASIALLLSARAATRDTTLPALLADPATAREADAICDALGDLPLALTLACAFLESMPHLPLDRYRTRLESQGPADPSLGAEALPTAHATSIVATFALSYDQLRPDAPADALARTLLHCAAACAPAPIPRPLLLRAAGLDPADEDAAGQADAALGRLAALGLLEALPTGDLRLHRLLAAFARARAPTPQPTPPSRRP